MLLITMGCFPALHRRTSSIQWPVVEGAVSSTGLKLYMNKPRTAPSFTPVVVYSYTVDGIPHLGTRIDFSDSTLTFRKEEALAWLQRNYPVGKRVAVHYDRADPDFAVLVPGAPDLVIIWWCYLGATTFCVVLSLAMHAGTRRALSATQAGAAVP
jgi:hypothetical protein